MITYAVQGIIDIDSKISKFENKLEKTKESFAALQKKTRMPDYENRVPADIREANNSKVGSQEKMLLLGLGIVLLTDVYTAQNL